MNEPYAMPPCRRREGRILRACTNSRQRKQEVQAARAALRSVPSCAKRASARHSRAKIRRGRRLERHQLQSAVHRCGGTERGTACTPGKAARPIRDATLADAPGALVAATDYIKTLPSMVSKWMPRRLATLGTDGFAAARAASPCANSSRSTTVSSR